MRCLILKIILVSCCAIILFACSRQQYDLRVGVMAGAEEELAEIAKEIAESRYQLKVKLIVFSDYQLPNIALHQKEIDLNIFQHIPYLEEEIVRKKYDFEVVGKTFLFPIVGYSYKYKQLEEIPNKAKVGITTDPTNQGRALLLLQELGLIVLKDNVGYVPTVLDIVKNDKKLIFNEIDAAQLPRTLVDLDFAIINNSFASHSGLTEDEHGLFKESIDSPYVNVIVANKGDYDKEKIKQFIQAYQSDKVLNKAKLLFDNNVVAVWKE